MMIRMSQGLDVVTIINNILTSGLEFEEGEDLLHFKFRMLNIMLLIGIVGLLVFALLHDLGINDLGDNHARSNYFASAICLLAFLWLRQSKSRSKLRYKKIAMMTICGIMISFTSALLYVPNDEFRLVWFFIAMILGHLVVGNRFGFFIVALSILIVVSGNQLMSLSLSNHTLITFVMSLLIASLMMAAYSSKIIAYEANMLRQNGELKNMVNRDLLTGIMSRRFFMDMANHFFSASLRNKSPITLLMLDIDYFKNINDSYGHHIGDQMLIVFTETVSRYLRKSDIFGRLGGEEFGVVLFETDASGAMVLAEKIRQAIEDARYDVEGISIKMTTSIGVGERIDEDGSFERMIIRTDEALYHAKKGGRNCISMAH